jgi:hypothetical protein
MNDDKTIYVNDGKNSIPVEWHEPTIDDYLDKTTLIFGGTGSGKTYMIEELMELLSDHVSNYLVIAPQTSQLRYSMRLPKKCLKEDISKKKLQSIWIRQTQMTQVCNIANDITVLESLFKRLNNRHLTIIAYSIIKRCGDFVTKIENSNISFLEKKNSIAQIESLKNTKLISLYKDAIREKRDILCNMNLTNYEKTAIEYLDTNPKLMIIIDDCSEKFDKWMKYFKKTEENIFSTIAFRGRHNNISLVVACHDDKFMPTEIRKNARVIKFGNMKALTSCVDKPGSAFSSSEKKQAKAVGEKIFNESDTQTKKKNHQKICYIRDDKNPFKYTIAKISNDRKLGCDALYELVKKMPTKFDKIDNNPFVKFAIYNNEQ